MIQINKRSIGACIVLSLITFGIYLIYWEYLLVKNTRSIKKDDSSCLGEMLCLIFVPFYSLYWWYTRGKLVRDEFSKQGYSVSSNEIAFLVLALFGLGIVSMAIMQNDFNSLPFESTQSNQRSSKNNSVKNPLFHINRKLDIVSWKAWLIRSVTVIVALLICAIVTEGLSKGSFGMFFKYLFYGTFGTPRRILLLFQNTAMLLIVALAVTPAFKMKFWNIGAEGQILMGALMGSVVMYFFGQNISNNFLMLIIMLIFSVLAGAIWAVIPAIFKAQWNTNETLFTLMLNYVATRLVSYTINSIVTSGSGTMGLINASTQLGWIPKLGGYDYIINILIVAFLAVLLALYMKYSKHGFELSVVGESINTAKYVGINVKKVIIRTMILSGALCGVAGFLLVSGSAHTITATLSDGRGFTAILVSWLGQFNPLIMAITSFLVIFIDQGSSEVATMLRFGTAFSELITGIFFFLVIACEFFINYKVTINLSILKRIKIKKQENKNKEVEA